ncbi:Asp-tRNA(Asn)/Glu-tRNA(Gln) amidotransferase subunit GatC [Candidatus Roizmanbacteria bacterium]|nr:Asp-tRNA(Asn)/Glu-tRNA(Gln) amidotransferase subunit GatC [Candidatus Roizmanbacteria bacterium]
MKSFSKLKREDILHLAKLANIKLTEEEIVKFQKQLSEVVNYIRLLDSLNTDDVEAVSQLTDLVNVTRVDKVSTERSLSQNEAMKNTKSKKNGYFKVKSVF